MSIINQVKRSIDFATRIGTSKKEYRKLGKKHYIHSKSQLEKTKTISCEFANFVRDNHKIKNLHEIKEEHYRHFLATKAHRTAGHQRNIETALQQLQKGMHIRAEKYNKEPTHFMTERLIPTAKRAEDAVDRSYTHQEIEKMKSFSSSGDTLLAIEIMEKSGLRISEVVSLQKNDIDFKNNKIYVQEGKGGKFREVSINNNEFKQYLADTTTELKYNQHLIKNKAKTIIDDARRTAKRAGIQEWNGTHGLRHTYARNEVDRLMSIEEKRMFDRCINHYIEGKKFDYGIKDYERGIYNSMKKKMDEVHQSLGHGKNRFDLAVRYMK